MDLFKETIPKEDSCYLISLDSKNKIRVFYTHYEQVDYYYQITRYSSQYRGKKTWGPVIEVLHGKVNRTILEQTKLQWDHLKN